MQTGFVPWDPVSVHVRPHRNRRLDYRKRRPEENSCGDCLVPKGVKFENRPSLGNYRIGSVCRYRSGGHPFVQRNVSGLGEMLGGEHLKPDEFVFAGEWYGERGTYIRIHLDGTGDFISGHSRVRGGRVRISGKSLSIGLLGMSKNWRIDRRPHMENGYWTMRLEGELFKRKGDDFTVKLRQPNVRANKWQCMKPVLAVHQDFK